MKHEHRELEIGTPSNGTVLKVEETDKGKLLQRRDGRNEGNLKLADGTECCKQIPHVCASNRIKDDGSSPRGRIEHFHLFIGFQVFSWAYRRKRKELGVTHE